MKFIFIITLFQGLTLLIFKSDACLNNSVLNYIEGRFDDDPQLYSSECAWDDGSYANIASIVLWFLTAVAMLILGRPTARPREPPETQAVTYQQTTNPEDGTTTVQEVAVVKGKAVPQPAVTVPPGGDDSVSKEESTVPAAAAE